MPWLPKHDLPPETKVGRYITVYALIWFAFLFVAVVVVYEVEHATVAAQPPTRADPDDEGRAPSWRARAAHLDLKRGGGGILYGPRPVRPDRLLSVAC